MIVAPRASVFASGKEGEAGHPRVVDGAGRRPEGQQRLPLSASGCASSE